MQVTLVDPYYLSGKSPPNWALGQLEILLLDAGHQVRVMDFHGEDAAFPSLLQFRLHEAEFFSSVVAAAANSDVVYITTSFGIPQKPTPILERIRRLLDLIDATAWAVPIIIGGAQIDYLTIHGANPFAAMGEDAHRITAFLTSDAQFPVFAAAIGSRKPLDEIPGAWLPTAGGGAFTGKAPPWRIDALRRPEWIGWSLENYPAYRAVLTSFGCRYGCSFCFESKQDFQPLSVRQLFTGFIDAGLNRLAIEDSTLFGAHGTGALLNAFEQLSAPGRYSCYALVPEVCRASADTLAAFRRFGLESVIMGIESPDDATLRKYHKSVSPERARIAVRKLHDAGITAQGCLMVGIPDVDLDTTLYTFEYARQLPLDVRRWHVFQPSFDAMPKQIVTDRPVSVERFAMAEVNLPDALLPEIVEDASTETLLEEHFLVRALPHMPDAPEGLERVRYAAGYSLRDLYGRMAQELRGTQESFNEESYYAVLDADRAGPGEIRV